MSARQAGRASPRGCGSPGTVVPGGGRRMSGLLSVVGGDGAAGALVRLPRRRTPSWAVADPVVELAERLAEACASAVHPDEIAALLESEGLTDEQITERYEHRDLFALAGTLFALVPRAYPEAGMRPPTRGARTSGGASCAA